MGVSVTVREEAELVQIESGGMDLSDGVVGVPVRGWAREWEGRRVVGGARLIRRWRPGMEFLDVAGGLGIGSCDIIGTSLGA